MSYAITEAERKHVATIEDTNVQLVRVNDGTAKGTPAYEIHLNDGDKLNEIIKLPNIEFVVNKEDDENSRVRLLIKDDTGLDQKQITLDGLTGNSGNPLGLGWRFKVTFGKDKEGFIDSMIVERKNDGRTWPNKIDKLSNLIIRNLKIGTKGIDGAPDIGGDLTVNGTTILNGPLECNSSISIGGSTVGSDGISSDGLTTLNDLTVTGKLTANEVHIDNDKIVVTPANEENNTPTVLSIDKTNVVGTNDSNFDLSNANITNLEAENTVVDNLESSNTTLNGSTNVSGEFVAEKLNVNETLESKNINVTNLFQAKNGVFAENITSNNSFNTKTASISESATIKNESVEKSTITDLTVDTEKVANSEINNLKVKNTLETPRFKSNTIEAEYASIENADIGNIRTDSIHSADGQNNLVSFGANDQIQVGDTNKVLVLNSAPNDDGNINARNRITVVCGDNVTHLATLEDIRQENFNGVVDLTTNQTIGGVKRFKNQIIADYGIVAPDNFDQNKVVNVVTRTWDPNDPDVDFAENPDFVSAKAMSEAYDENLEKYNAANRKRIAAITAKDSLTYAETYFDEISGRLTQKTTELEEVSSEIDGLNSSIEASTISLSEKNGLYDNDIAEYAMLGGVEVLQNKQTSYNEATALIADLNEVLTEFANESGSASSIFDNLENIKNEEVSIEDKIVSLRQFIHEYTDVSWQAIYEAANNELIVLYPEKSYTVNNETKQLNSIQSFVDIYDFLERFTWTNDDAEDLNRCIELRAEIETLRTEIVDLNANIEENNAQLSVKKDSRNILSSEVDSLTSEKNSLQENVNTKTEIFNQKLEEYKSFYVDYMDEEYPTTTDEENIIATLTSPEEMTEGYDAIQYKRFKLGLINENIPTAEHDKIIEVGNNLDELHFKSDALEDGDEHIQSLIGQKYHKIANLDDVINANFALYTDNNVVGDTDINTLDNEIEFILKKNKIKTAEKAIPEDLHDMNNSSGDDPALAEYYNNEPEGFDETIFTLKGSSVISIEKEEDNENVAIIKLNDAAFLAALRDYSSQYDVKDIDGKNGVAVDSINKIDGSVDDSLKIESDRQHLVIKKGEDTKTVNLDVNVYAPDMDLGHETLEGYVNAYERLEATGDNLDLMANALAVKSLHNDSVKQIQQVQHELDTRVPPSPSITGRYGLVANVVANENGGVSSLYSWDGTITGLPEIYDDSSEEAQNSTIHITRVEQHYNKETGKVESQEVSVPVILKKDWNDEPLQFYNQDHPVEYIPKMRLYAQMVNGQVHITPVIKWVPMDYNGHYVDPNNTHENGEDPNDPNNGGENGNNDIDPQDIQDNTFIVDDDNVGTGGN